MSERWIVRKLEDVAGFETPGSPRWAQIRSDLGITAFGINAWTSTAADQSLIGKHTEVGGGAGAHEELYVVLTGHATFTVAGEQVDAPAGELVFVGDPSVEREALAHEPGTTVLVVGGARGEPFTVSAWERYAEGLAFFGREEYDQAVEFFERAHREDPTQAGVLYNLACAESRLGRTDDALAHLAEAIELNAPFLEAAQTDPDFDPVRDEPRFPRPE
jgi:tetratricopeptide (TPR) repeat protein